MIWYIIDKNGKRVDPNLAPVDQDSFLIANFNASENVPAFNAVTSDGFSADSNNIAHRNKVIGINRASVNSGFVGNATVTGELSNPAWNWVRGAKLFLNGTTISAAAPTVGFSVQIGTASKSDTIIVLLQTSILL